MCEKMSYGYSPAWKEYLADAQVAVAGDTVIALQRGGDVVAKLRPGHVTQGAAFALAHGERKLQPQHLP